MSKREEKQGRINCYKTMGIKSLQRTLWTSIVKHREQIAFDTGVSSITYRQLAERVAFLQSVLTENNSGLKSIGIIANQDFDTYAMIVAALLSGITYVPIEPSHPDERNNHIIQNSKVKAIYCSDVTNLSKEFYELNKSVFISTDAINLKMNEMRVVETENPAYILFTSGSTGVPKGVPISMQNLEAFTNNVAQIGLNISEHSRFLQVFDLTFDLSVFSYLVPLLHGASVFTLPETPLKQMAAIQICSEQAITHVLTVPSFVTHLKPFFAKIKLPAVQNWLFCGEALKADMVNSWQKCVPQATIYNVYGPTEATIFCTSYPCQPENVKEYHGIVCIGKPFGDVSFGLFDDTARISSHETNAELCISGSQLTSGYLGDPEKNKSAFFTSGARVFYRSGDLCRVDKQGDYFFVGRNDTQVKINGYRVEIGELEYHAANFRGIDEAVVIVTSNRENGKQGLSLVYTAKSVLNSDEIVKFLSRKLPVYMLPGNIYFVKSIPHNVNGKIDKKQLAEHISTIN